MKVFHIELKINIERFSPDTELQGNRGTEERRDGQKRGLQMRYLFVLCKGHLIID